MIKHILAAGDSFTYGEELSDRNVAWPYLVAAELGAAVTNTGIPSGGNTQITRNVIEHVLSDNPPDLVLIGWTSPGRVEFCDDEGTFDIWPGYAGKWTHHDHRSKLADYINRHHDAAYLYKQYITNIILLQTFLKYHNIKYLMMVVAGNEYYKNTFANEFIALRGKVDADYFVGAGKGMAEWTYKLPQGPNRHFLDEGHRVVADKVLAKIKLMGWA